MNPTTCVVPTNDHRRRRSALTVMHALVAALLITGGATAGNVDLPRFPSISPNCQEIVLLLAR